MNANILIIDDEKDICESLSAILRDEGHTVSTAESYDEKQNLDNIDIVFQDVWLKEQNGLEILHQIKEKNPSVFVVMISGHGSIDMAVEAVKKDAFDFLEKPLSIERIMQTIQNILQYKEMRKTLIASKNLARQKDPFIMEDKNIHLTVEKAEAYLKTSSFVFITGASGSGKTALARYLYYMEENPLSRFQMCPVAIVPNDDITELLEAENFSERFLVLEDIEVLSRKNQQIILKLLKKIEKQKNGNKYIFTTRETLENIRQNRYLDDAFLQSLQRSFVQLPSLNERSKDIPALVALFIENISSRSGFAPIKITGDAMKLFSEHQWQGNVTELFNLIERLTLMSPRREIDVDLLQQFIEMGTLYWKSGMSFNSLKEAASYFEKSYIYYTVQKYDGNITRAADELQIERTHLYRKFNKLGLTDIRRKIQIR